MPKRIENLRETILAHARDELLLRGYDALTIRSVANACGIAVGTVYNYYPSKDMLTASVILGDWLVTLEGMQRACAAAESTPAALLALYAGVTVFSDTYSSVWAGYSFSAGAKSAYGKRHNLLVQQLAACIRPVLARCAPDAPAGLDVFFAENILICSGTSLMTMDTFLQIAERILA